MPLFTDTFPEVHSDEELERLLALHPSYDPYYVASGAIGERRERFEALFAVYAPYADTHYLSEVKHQFHQRTWEMFLGALLVAQGMHFESKDSGPDIKLDGPLWIEAVACARGDGVDRVPDLRYGGVQTVPHDEMLIRMANGLAVKYQGYQKYLSAGMIGPSDPYVIALNAGGFGHIVDPQIPLVLKGLFGIGYEQISIPSGAVSWSRRESIEKKSGSQVPMTFFEQAEHAGVSCVLYCRNNVLNAAEPMGADIILVHNPLATNPINLERFPFLTQYRVEGGALRRHESQLAIRS